MSIGDGNGKSCRMGRASKAETLAGIRENLPIFLFLLVFSTLAWDALADGVTTKYENAWQYYSEESCCMSTARHHKHKDFISEFTCGHLFYKTLHVDDATGFLYVGAMDYVFRLNLSDISRGDCEKNSLHLEATDTSKCIKSGKSEIYECRNHIHVIENIGEDLLYICGTNAHSPRDLVIYKNLKHLPRHIRFGHIGSGVGRCPGSPSMRAATAWVGSPFFALLSGTYVDSTLADRLFVRWDLQRGELGYKRTARYNTKWLDAPDFLALYTMKEHAFALIREHGSCNRHESRIVRVCLNDQGSARHPRDWTTFIKATLSCNAPHFHNLENVYRIPGDDSRIYGLFTSGTNPVFSGSAICSFTMSSLAGAFAGKFGENTGNGDARQPVPDDKVPEPRPGSCVPDTTRLSDKVVNFIRSHPLMYETVNAEYGKPLYIQRDEHFTVFAVDRVKRDKEENYYVYYCGTNAGLVYKVVQWDDSGVANTFLSDVWKVFNHEPVEALTLSKAYKSVYFASGHRLKQIKTDEICKKYYEGCSRCSRDPYCGWNINLSVCEPYRHGLYQDVENASPKGCEKFIIPKHISATFGQSVMMSSHFTLPEVMKRSNMIWRRRRNGDSFLLISSERYILTADHSLVILGLGTNDAGIFELRQENRLIAAYNLTIDEDRCGHPLHNGSYHRIYQDWCREFVKHKEAMQAWEVKRNMVCPKNYFEWTDRTLNNPISLE